MMRLVDSHSHLDVEDFDADRSEVLDRAATAGVHAHVIAGIALDDFPRLQRVCAADPRLFPAYGLHPLFIDRHRPRHLDELKAWLQAEAPVALGECGLDFYIRELDRDVQRDYFHAQLELARELDLPVILHARRAVEEVTQALRQVGGLRGVVHSFGGSAEQARQLFELGFHLGIGGPVTYPRARRLREIVARMPLEWLLLETDAPDQPLHGHQGRRNEPAFLADIARTVAELRGEPVEAVARATSANARALFGLQPDVAA